MNRVYTYLMYLGKISGCHQKRDRSFIIKDKQFPVCARCTGVLIGYFVGGLLYILKTYTISFEMLIMLPLIMFFDWALQYFKVLHSTNLRRIITGFLCGVVFGNYYIPVINYILSIFRMILRYFYI